MPGPCRTSDAAATWLTCASNAAARASIGINIVAIIAALAGIDAPVAADLGKAFGRTAISVVAVAVVAFFKAFVFRR